MYKTLLFKFRHHLCNCLQGSTFRKNPWGQLAPNFSDLVASRKYFIEKREKLVATEKNWLHWQTQWSQC